MVTISSEIRISAPPAAVWSVLATPSQQPVVEPRTQLVSEWGEPGTVGSGYEPATRGRPTTRLHVTEAVPGELHGAGCLLTYTMSIDVPLVLRPVQRAYGKKQLSRWLDAVARVSAA